MLNADLLIGVTVEWEEVLYSAREGDGLTVCAEHQEQTEKEFTLTIPAPQSPG